MDEQQLLRYSRHILLGEIGYEGQKKLSKSKVLLIGVGGIGCPAAVYLAAAGIGTITICDHDKVELTNLQRQVLYVKKDISYLKTASAQKKMSTINPNVQIETHNFAVDEKNIPKLVKNADIVLDATDRFATRHLINKTCVELQTPLVIAAASKFDGQLLFVNPLEINAPCYECIFPKADGAIDDECSTLGVFAPITGIMGVLQASIAIKFLAGMVVEENKLLLINLFSDRFQHINIRRNVDCILHK